MEHLIYSFVEELPIPVLLLIVAAMLGILSKGADLLVDEAVSLSIRLGISKVIIGATVVSLGTTLPEVSVSVFAALTGNPGLALGNAVGSIICDTGLILGLAAIISPLPIERKLVNRQGFIQLGAGILLILLSFPYSHAKTVFSEGGFFPQWSGFVFLALLIGYLFLSKRWADEDKSDMSEGLDIEADEANTFMIILKLVIGIVLVIVSSRILIPTVEVTAIRIGIPQGIIAATLVAFGTSLPELVTAMTAVKKGHGELAIGNVIGADILNALFVVGASAAVTRAGLTASRDFFLLMFPVMIGVLLVFRLGIIFSPKALGRVFGIILLLIYVAYIVASYMMGLIA